MTELPATALIHAMKTPLLLIGKDDQILAQNAAMTALLNIDETGSHYVTVLRQPATIDAVGGAHRDQVTKTARFINHVEHRDQIFEVTAIPVEGHVVVSFNDQTAAEDAVALRRDFVANVSHELRTPLTALTGFIETLRGPAKDDPDAQARFLGIMAHEADRLGNLVNDLLSLSRVEEQERSRPADPVDLARIVKQAVDLLAPLASDAQMTIQTHIPEDLPTVPGDEAQLQQVLTNLIENAIKYGASPKGLLVAVYPPAYKTILRQSAVRVVVQDFGQGIPEHHLVRLTERFYRVDTHRSRAGGGTGLGLAIVKHIANRHRGRLAFESVEGAGTTVTLLLPAAVQPK